MARDRKAGRDPPERGPSNAVSASGRSLPPDPFEPLLRWTQKEGGRAPRGRGTSSAVRPPPPRRSAPEKENAMRRGPTRAPSRRARASPGGGAPRAWRTDACLAVDAPGERDPLTLTAFVRALRDSARAGRRGVARGGRRAGGRKRRGPAGDAVRFQERREPRAGGGGGARRRRDGALARVRDRARRRAGGCRRRHAKAPLPEGGQRARRRGPGDPDAVLGGRLRGAGGRARGARRAAQMGGIVPLDVRFARFRRAMRPRSVRLAERKRAEPEAREQTRGDAFGPEIEAERASARADRLAAEGRSRAARAGEGA